eukprot:506507-Hanusia_phi.AAC.1
MGPTCHTRGRTRCPHVVVDLLGDVQLLTPDAVVGDGHAGVVPQELGVEAQVVAVPPHPALPPHPPPQPVESLEVFHRTGVGGGVILEHGDDLARPHRPPDLHLVHVEGNGVERGDVHAVAPAVQQRVLRPRGEVLEEAPVAPQRLVPLGKQPWPQVDGRLAVRGHGDPDHPRDVEDRGDHLHNAVIL